MRKGRKGGNPETYFKTDWPEKIAERPISVKLPIEVDEYVRSLPNRTEWLRQAIVSQFKQDKCSQAIDCKPGDLLK